MKPASSNVRLKHCFLGVVTGDLVGSALFLVGDLCLHVVGVGGRGLIAVRRQHQCPQACLLHEWCL